MIAQADTCVVVQIGLCLLHNDDLANGVVIGCERLVAELKDLRFRGVVVRSEKGTGPVD